MANYFSNFQKALYSLETDKKDLHVVTNLLHRSTFLREVATNTAIYYSYTVQEDDTPEIIADKLYGDSSRHWIVLLFNSIMNPYYRFPMTPRVLGNFIETKYGITLEEAMQTIHSYEEEETRRVTAYTGSSYVVSESIVRTAIDEWIIDPDTGHRSERSNMPVVADTETFASSETAVIIPGEQIIQIDKIYRALSIFTYEDRINENNRFIKLLDAKYVPRVEQEFKELMGL